MNKVGRGRHMHAYNRPYNKPPMQSNIPPRIFDLTLCEKNFPRINPVKDENLQNCVLKQVQELTPSEDELSKLTALAAEVQNVFDAIIKNPGSLTACTIEESRQVGSLKKGTILKGRKIADVVVVLKTLPFVKSIELLANRVLEDLKKVPEISNFVKIGYNYKINDGGFDIISLHGVVRVRITTVSTNYTKLDPSAHVAPEILDIHSMAIRHCRWFEENCQNDIIKNMVRILRYFRDVYEGMSILTPWMIDLLANYVVMNTPNKEPLPEGAALKRVLQLLAAGLFLQGSSGIPDPADKNRRIHLQISLEKQDILCLTAQNLLRVLVHGGPVPIFSGKSTIITSSSLWKGVIVNPLDKAYEPPTPPEPKDEEMPQVKLEEQKVAT